MSLVVVKLIILQISSCTSISGGVLGLVVEPLGPESWGKSNLGTEFTSMIGMSLNPRNPSSSESCSFPKRKSALGISLQQQANSSCHH